MDVCFTPDAVPVHAEHVTREPLPPAPFSYVEVVDSLSRAVDVDAGEVLRLLPTLEPRFDCRHQLLWSLAEAAVVSLVYLPDPARWWRSPRTEQHFDTSEPPPWDYLTDPANGVSRYPHIHAAIGYDIAAAWWGPAPAFIDPNSPWSVEAPRDIADGGRYPADDGAGERVWCEAFPADADGRRYGNWLRDVPHPPGPLSRLWSGTDGPYFTLGPGPHLYPGERLGPGDGDEWRALDAAVEVLLTRWPEADPAPDENIRQRIAALRGARTDAYRELHDLLGELVLRSTTPVSGLALGAQRQLGRAAGTSLERH